MDMNSLIYIYNETSTNYKEINDFCTKTDINFLECNKEDLLIYLMKNINPMFIVIDNNASNEYIEQFAKNNPKCFIYTFFRDDLTVDEKNLNIVYNCATLKQKICNDLKFRSNISMFTKKDENLCYTLVYKELNKLSFRSKLVGAKYIAELIAEIILTTNAYNGKCSNMYPRIALRYNTNTGCIERAMRFSIQNAFETCQDKKMFYEISKTNKAPTVKELMNYVLDKVVLQMNKYISE